MNLVFKQHFKNFHQSRSKFGTIACVGALVREICWSHEERRRRKLVLTLTWRKLQKLKKLQQLLCWLKRSIWVGPVATESKSKHLSIFV